MIDVSPEVAAALADAAPVVALESTLIVHGMPPGRRLDVADRINAAVRAQGAVPATVGVLDGRLVVGLSDEQLERLATTAGVLKISARDLAPALALGRDGATTVASTAVAATQTGIGVFATGGLGGVHRQARDSWDESADLTVLSRTPLTVVCSGVKSILDVTATLERLESLSVTVLGYRTDRFAGFYRSDSGHRVPWRVDSPGEIAEVMRCARELALGPSAVVVANPVAVDGQLDADLHDRILVEALSSARAAGVTGKDVTPHLLDHFHSSTGGRSVEVNIAVILGNAALAAEIAVAAAAGQAAPPAGRAGEPAR